MEICTEICSFSGMNEEDLYMVNGGSWAGVGTVLASIGMAVAITVAIVTIPVTVPFTVAMGAASSSRWLYSMYCSNSSRFC